MKMSLGSLREKKREKGEREREREREERERKERERESLVLHGRPLWAQPQHNGRVRDAAEPWRLAMVLEPSAVWGIRLVPGDPAV